MSEAPTDPARGLRSEWIIGGLVAGLVLAAAIYLGGQQRQVLRNSPAGLDGLQIWLNSEGVATQSFSGGWLMQAESVGLLIVPIYDSDLGNDRVAPRTKDELLLQQDEYDLFANALRDKAEASPTLVVLPKWRSGMRLTGLAHPVLTLERRRVRDVLRDLVVGVAGEVQFAPRAFTDFPTQDGRRARIYAAQTLSSRACKPVIGNKEAMLLGRCRLQGAPTTELLVLADPDLLNNHGLRLGDNAHIVRDLIQGEAGGKTVTIDYAPGNWLTSAGAGQIRERSWADLLRFFDPPFLALWIGAGVLLALALWRAARRFGPVAAERLKIEASKAYAMRARARLMRLSDQDGALVAEYARARIAASAARKVGPAEARRYGQRETFLGFVTRRNPKRAGELRAALAAIDALPPRVPGREAIAHVTAIEQVLEHIINDT